MFEDFFENNAPADEEQPGRERTEQIKAAVLQRITRVNAESEEKKMKRIHLRPFVIAAAAAAVGAGSLVTANAATNGAVADSMTRALTVFSGDSAEQSGEWTEVSEGDDGSVVYYTAPDDEEDKSYYSAATIVKREGDVVYYTFPDGVQDGEDILYDFIFSLENDGAAK